MRTEALYLDDIIDAADSIARFLNDLEKENFLGDELAHRRGHDPPALGRSRSARHDARNDVIAVLRIRQIDQQAGAGGEMQHVRVRVDQPRHQGRATQVDLLRALTRQRAHFGFRADAEHATIGGLRAEVWDVPAHTAGHIAYYLPSAGVIFVGDTLFAMGCGRLFEGTADQMFANMQRFAALDGATRVYCAHKYTLSNAKFAVAMEQLSAKLVDFVGTATDPLKQLLR